MNKFSLFSNTRGFSKPREASASANDYRVSSENRSAAVGKAQDSATDERALVRSARQGDLYAFNRLVLAYQDKAYTLAFYLLGDMMVAEDAVQETFISAYRSIQSCRGDSFRSWLFRMVTNKCLDELRRRKRHPITPFEATDIWGEEIESPQRSVDTVEIPEESMSRAGTDRYLLRCLDRLKTEDRIAIVLVDILELRYGEAAKIIGCPPGTVKSRLACARLQMQPFLQEVS